MGPAVAWKSHPFARRIINLVPGSSWGLICHTQLESEDGNQLSRSRSSAPHTETLLHQSTCNHEIWISCRSESTEHFQKRAVSVGTLLISLMVSSPRGPPLKWMQVSQFKERRSTMQINTTSFQGLKLPSRWISAHREVLMSFGKMLQSGAVLQFFLQLV